MRKIYSKICHFLSQGLHSFVNGMCLYIELQWGIIGLDHLKHQDSKSNFCIKLV